MEEKGSSEEMESDVGLSCGFDSTIVPTQQQYWIDNTNAIALKQWMYQHPYVPLPHISFTNTNFITGSSSSAAYHHQASFTPPLKNYELKKTPVSGSPMFNTSSWYITPAEVENPNVWYGLPLLEDERQEKVIGESSQSLIQDGISTTDGSGSKNAGIVLDSATTQRNKGKKLGANYESDRRRRKLIGERLKALQELVPQSTMGHHGDVLEDVIDYVKFLQLQLKDLSQSRLGGEPVSDPLIFIEGYGHYFVNEPMVNEPLDEIMGRLLEVNPEEAAAILESKGLFIRDMEMAGGLQRNV